MNRNLISLVAENQRVMKHLREKYIFFSLRDILTYFHKRETNLLLPKDEKYLLNLLFYLVFYLKF